MVSALLRTSPLTSTQAQIRVALVQLVSTSDPLKIWLSMMVNIYREI